MMESKNQLDGKHAILLLVRYINEFRLEALYARELRLSFVPTIGMQFLRSGTNSMWTSENGEVVPPLVESVIYDFDEGDDHKGGEGLIVCSFTVTQPLTSSFWGEPIDTFDIANCPYHEYLLPTE
ncbi:MAG TPA: hypothetical protein DDX04_05575 [Massilia sp.]|nr:hypothetical protein [Massilia sp.]